jgi:hypothetical protein
MSTADESSGPEFEVWNHMESGLQMARDDLANSLPGDDRRLYEALAQQFVGLRFGVVVTPEDVPDSPFLRENYPQIKPDVLERFVRQLPNDPKTWDPFLRHAVEIEIAERSIDRMYNALDRYTRLAGVLVRRSIPERVRPYLREVSETYLFGFDPACIALACSSFEQVAKVALVAVGATTDARLKREKPNAEGLRHLLHAEGLIRDSDPHVQRLINKRNTVLHRGMFDEKVLPQLSLDSIAELAAVCSELAPSWPTGRNGR